MLRLVIAAAFKAKGKRSMSKSELTYLMSFDLKWFTHDKSKLVVEKAVKKGLLVSEGDKLKPAFDISKVNVPVDFKPDLSSLEYTTIFEEIVEEISVQTGIDRKKIISEINAVQEKFEGLLDIEVVALVVARKYGVDVSQYVSEVKKSVLAG